MGLKEAVLVFGRKARAIETRQFFKEFLYFAGFLLAELDRSHIAPFGESIRCKLAPQTAKLLGIQVFLEAEGRLLGRLLRANDRREANMKRRRRSVRKRNRQ